VVGIEALISRHVLLPFLANRSHKTAISTASRDFGGGLGRPQNASITGRSGFRLATPTSLTPPKRLNLQDICLIRSIEVNYLKTKGKYPSGLWS
jgi:hypothetical protein